MANIVEPRRAVDVEDVASGDTGQDGELTALIRRWMAAGGTKQDRRRRESGLRLAPEPEAIEHPRVAPGRVAPGRVEPEGIEPEGIEPEAASAAFPPLPQRVVGDQAVHVHRVALLIDARRVSADAAAGLLHRLAERGSVNVCRAYADWSRADLGDWVGQLRREGLHSFHHFAEDDDQALVAMTIDAVDIARDAAVDEVVIAGDLTSALPLVHRLHAAGVRVVAVGSASTPHDVRAACHEFIDTSTIDGTRGVQAGRHRA